MAIAGEFLPPVITRLTMDLDGFLAGIAEAKAALQALKDDTVGIDVDVAGAILGSAQLEVLNQILRETRDSAASLMMTTSLLDGALTALNVIQRDTADSSADLMMMNRLLAESFEKLSIDVTASAAAMAAAVAVNNASTASNTRAYKAWFRNGTIIHWIISGTAELAAVLLPATVAFAAFAFVWLQGATNVYQHLNALFDATEALGQASGKTYGEMLGLKGVFQQMQNAANPQVYQALGAGLLLVRESTGGLAETGYKLGTVFDTFLAKVVTDFSKAGQAGSTMNLALAHMEPDAIELARVFGNLGAALVSVATQMPGLAEFLLGTLADILDLIKWVVELTGEFHAFGLTLLTLAIGFEEFNRWGGLIAALLDKIGLASTDVEGKWYTLIHTSTVFLNLFRALPLLFTFVVQGMGNLMSKLTILGSGFTSLGSKVAAAGADMEKSVRAITLGTALWITIAVAALAIEAAYIVHILKASSATQVFVNSLVKASESMTADTRLMNFMGDNIEVFAARSDQAARSSAELGDKINAMGGPIQYIANNLQLTGRGLGLVNQQLHDNADIGTYTIGISELGQNMVKAQDNAEMLARSLHISVPEAMSLAQIAGVNLTQTLRTQSGAWTDLGNKIRAQLMGFRAMGAASGEVGHDMQMVAVQEGLTASKMQTVEQAFQSFISNVTGGSGALAQLVTSIAQMGHVTAHTAENLGTAASISESVRQEADAIAHFGSTGAQAMTNFDQVVGASLPQLIQWFQTAQAEGAITGPKFQQAIYDMIAPMIPFASKSKEAQTELLALAQAGNTNIKTFPQLVEAIQAAHGHLGGLQSIVTSTTSNMADLSKVAENLGNVVDSDLTSAIVSAWTNFYHLDGAVKTLTEDQQKYGDNSRVTAAAAQHVAQVLQEIQQHAQSTTRAIDQQTQATNRLHAALEQLHSRWITVHVQEAIAVHGNGGVPGPGAPTPRSEGGSATETTSAVLLDGKKVGRVISKNAVRTQKRAGTNQMQKRRR